MTPRTTLLPRGMAGRPAAPLSGKIPWGRGDLSRAWQSVSSCGILLGLRGLGAGGTGGGKGESKGKGKGKSLGETGWKGKGKGKEGQGMTREEVMA